MAPVKQEMLITDFAPTDAILHGKPQRPALLDVLGHHSALDLRRPGRLGVLDELAEREREAARDEVGREGYGLMSIIFFPFGIWSNGIGDYCTCDSGCKYMANYFFEFSANLFPASNDFLHTPVSLKFLKQIIKSFIAFFFHAGRLTNRPSCICTISF